MHTGVKAIGRFHVLGTLGNGAHSTILHIRRNADSKAYALKVVALGDSSHWKFLEQAKHEYEVAQRFHHPNLIRIHALEFVRNWLFQIRRVQLLIEYVNGRTLDTFPRIPIPSLLRIFAQIADGLLHMHRRGVLHADIKPNNVMLSRAGEVKIIDYGLAWIRGEHKGRVQGTPEYMAPEQMKNGIVNEKTDIYNFGATMYRLVTLRLPPVGLAVRDNLPIDSRALARMLRPVHECNAQAPRELCDLIHKCLAHNPHERPERVSEIYGVLDHLADQLVASPAQLEQLEW